MGVLTSIGLKMVKAIDNLVDFVKTDYCFILHSSVQLAAIILALVDGYWGTLGWYSVMFYLQWLMIHQHGLLKKPLFMLYKLSTLPCGSFGTLWTFLDMTANT